MGRDSALFCTLLLLMLTGFFLAGCGGDDDDDDSATAHDDDDSSPDDDDDIVPDDDDDDDDNDEDENADTYVAPWPQVNVETQDYDESTASGPLRQKVEQYDAWHKAHHQPFFGSTVGVLFMDDSRTDVESYFDTYDSCIWTGTYLAGQAFRYHVTGDAEARANAVRMVQALSGHLHVTGRPGFIARFRGPQDPRLMPANCGEEENCHVVDQGPFAGEFWWGNTSRDQYTGWFFGLSAAYDLVDDEDMRETIRRDVTSVLDELIRSRWWIIDVDGVVSTAAPNVMPSVQLCWSLIGYHMTGEDRFKKAIQRWIRNEERLTLRLGNITFFNRYSDHYGNNLGHQNFYNTLRLAEVYLGEEDYEFLLSMFDTQQHTFMRLAHNAFFTAIHMSQGIYEPNPGDDPYQAQLELDLADFRAAPNHQYSVTPPESELDPVSVWLHDFFEEHPFLKELLGGGISPQALEAYRVTYQCSTDFLWQRNPFALHCGESEMPRKVQPGVDYLIAYWMASYHRFLTKNQ